MQMQAQGANKGVGEGTGRGASCIYIPHLRLTHILQFKTKGLVNMDICDEIRIAWAEWVLRYKTDPVVVCLPPDKYKALVLRASGRSNVTGFTGLGDFCGMEVVPCRGEDILFASK